MFFLNAYSSCRIDDYEQKKQLQESFEPFEKVRMKWKTAKLEMFRFPGTFISRIDLGIVQSPEFFSTARELASEYTQIAFRWSFAEPSYEHVIGKSIYSDEKKKLGHDFIVGSNDVVSITQKELKIIF